MKEFVLVVLLQFVDGNGVIYPNQIFDSLKDCNTYQDLFDSTKNALVGQYLEDKVYYKEHKLRTLKEVSHVGSACLERVITRDKEGHLIESKTALETYIKDKNK
jgi:hypothetical protein